MENKAVDALSRYPTFADECSAISTISHLWVQKVIHSYTWDAFVTKNFTAKAIDSNSYEDLSISDGLLRYKEKVVVGLRELILQEVHNTTYVGSF